ncbi:MAG: mechanosensitive ion channel [Proteobacteria bacterium]|nr:mechanosensitive ion channel [Pseudomonadota bacterium]
MDFDSFIPLLKNYLALYGLKVLAAVVVFILGRWAAKITRGVTRKLLTRASVDPTIISFAANLSYFIILTFVVLAALAQLGIQTTSFIAIIGAAGLAIALSLQSSLSNFAAGFLMIIFHPFKVGDFIEGAGVTGTVEEIQIFSTRLKTPDNKIIIVPNGSLVSGNITNYSTSGTRRVDMVFGIGYDDDIDRAKGVIKDIISNDQRILKEPECFIGLVELADSSVNFAVRPWVNSADYFNVLCDTNESVKKRFDAEGISIPYPQQDVHLVKESSEMPHSQ